MKKLILVVFAVLTIMCFSACDNAPVIEKYYLDTSGNLIAEFEDGSTKDLGSLGDTIANGIKDIEISSDGYYVINGIKTDIVAVEVYDVTFDTGFSTKVSKQTIKDGYKIERPEIERKGYTLNGWYCNGEEWRFNSDVVKNDMVLTADWTANEYRVSFVTGIDSIESSITITYDSPYTLPELEQIGYTFDGWLYNGNLVTDNKWSINTDCTLTAKWTVNKYTVSLNANGGSVSPTSKKIEYGKPFTLPVATNSYGAFIGWFYNGEQITDSNGNSLFDWNYTTDIEVTTSWTIEISTVEDLQQLYTYPNAHFELKNNLDISLIEWTPVGTETKPFTGQIDGGNFIINGLKITQLQENQKYYGFIGYASSGKIFDLTFTNVNINLPTISNSIFVGSIIAKNENATLENIIVSGNISIANHSSSYESYAGGLIGYSVSDDIKNCVNLANVTAKNVAGGIIAYKDTVNPTCLFENNKNSGTITASTAGGLIGDGVYCNVIESKNAGNIIGEKYAGGIVGYGAGVEINKCINEGNITLLSTTKQTNDCAGGLVGFVSLNTHSNNLIKTISIISNSYNIGSIESVNIAGGIMGINWSAETLIQNCYNSGTIKGSSFTAGIAGYMYQETHIEQCVNLGEISSSDITGTIAGYSTFVIDNCYYNCTTSGIDFIQGSKATDIYSKEFYTTQLFWDNTVWDFHTDKLPTLKIESLFND